MDMPMSSNNGTSKDLSDSPMEPLSAVGVDLTNVTEASDYLEDLLDDSVLQFDGIKYSKFFWYGIVTVIGLAAVVNIYQRAVSFERKRKAVKQNGHPAKSSNPLTTAITTITSTIRVFMYIQPSPSRYSAILSIPPFGVILMLLAYLSFVLALQFVHVSIPGDAHWEAIGIRAGWLSIGQLPLIILLAGKYNIIGFLTGIGYERLNIFHRWVARTLLLTATLHFGYQSYGWNRLGLWRLEWDTDTCAPSGMAAYVLLVWMNVSTLRILRHMFYEFFVIQHLLTFLGFIIAIMYHLPLETAPSVRTYIWITIGLYLADRLARSIRYAYNNVRPGRATLTALPNGMTKISVRNAHIRNWRPGGFVLLSIPRFGLGQSHPATIASTPTSSDGEMIFLLRAHRGFTQRLTTQAKSDDPTQTALLRKADVREDLQEKGERTYLALINGPYSGVGADFCAFDSTILIAASTGVTFTLPILLSLADRVSQEQRRLPLRKLVFIHIVKHPSSKDLATSEIHSAITCLCDAGVEATAQIFVTCEYPTIDPSLDASCAYRDSDVSKGGCNYVSAIASPGDEGKKVGHCVRSHSEIAMMHEKQNTAIEQSIPVSTSRCSHGTGISVHTGRPNTKAILASALNTAEGEMGVAVCGPLELSQCVRRDVSSLTVRNFGGPGIFLHAESFGW